MLSIFKMSAASWEYYARLVRYYRGGKKGNRPGHDDDGFFDPDGDGGLEPDALTLPGEPPGIWMGEGAEYLGLYGTIGEEDLAHIFMGNHPRTGNPLVQNAGEKDRTPGWDLTFSVPKTVSLCWGGSKVERREQIDRAVRIAVERTLQIIGDRLTFSRVGKASVDLKWVSSKPVFAAFEHGSNREGEPQLHWHTLLMNIAVRPDGKTGAVDSRPIYAMKKVLGATFRILLAELLCEIGFKIERRGTSFEIVGVPEDLRLATSTRRKQVVEEQERTGFTGAKSAEKAALATRRTRVAIPSRAERFSTWQEDFAWYDFTPDSVEKLIGRRRRGGESTARAAVSQALKNVTATCNHFSEYDFLFDALVEGAGRQVPYQKLIAAFQQAMDSRQIERRFQRDGTVRYTTKAILRREQAKLFRPADILTNRSGATVSTSVLRRVLLKYPTLKAEQRRAVRHLTQGKGALRLVRGRAGTGKTKYVLKSTYEALRASGYRVIGVSAHASGATTLQNESGIPTTTIARLTGDYDLPLSYHFDQAIRHALEKPASIGENPPAFLPDNTRFAGVKHHLEQLGRAANKKPTSRTPKDKPVKIDHNTVIVVDEAGTANERQWQTLLRLANQRGATIFFVGDEKQTQPVEGTAPFLSLATRYGSATLKDISRQDEDWAKDAAKLFEAEEVAKALSMYAERGLITTAADMEEALDKLIAEWKFYGKTRPQDAPIICHKNAQVERANRDCQRIRLTLTRLLDKSRRVPIRHIDKNSGKTYDNVAYVGDRVLFTKNSRTKYKVDNGSLGTIHALKGKNIAVTLDNGRQVTVNVKDFPHIRLGYAMTVHKAQGGTFRRVFVLAGGPQQDHPTAYVQATRAKELTRFFTTEELLTDITKVEDSKLSAQMSEVPELTLATDLLSDFDEEKAIAELVAALLHQWTEDALQNPKDHVIIAPSEEDANRLNERCQELRNEHKADNGSIFQFNGNSFLLGDRIRLAAGSHGLVGKKGDLATVEAISPQQRSLTVKYDFGLTETLYLSQFPHVTHAYALTRQQAKRLHLRSEKLTTAFFFQETPSITDTKKHWVAKTVRSYTLQGLKSRDEDDTVDLRPITLEDSLPSAATNNNETDSSADQRTASELRDNILIGLNGSNTTQQPTNGQPSPTVSAGGHTTTTRLRDDILAALKNHTRRITEEDTKVTAAKEKAKREKKRREEQERQAEVRCIAEDIASKKRKQQVHAELEEQLETARITQRRIEQTLDDLRQHTRDIIQRDTALVEIEKKRREEAQAKKERIERVRKRAAEEARAKAAKERVAAQNKRQHDNDLRLAKEYARNKQRQEQAHAELERQKILEQSEADRKGRQAIDHVYPFFEGDGTTIYRIRQQQKEVNEAIEKLHRDEKERSSRVVSYRSSLLDMFTPDEERTIREYNLTGTRKHSRKLETQLLAADLAFRRLKQEREELAKALGVLRTDEEKDNQHPVLLNCISALCDVFAPDRKLLRLREQEKENEERRLLEALIKKKNREESEANYAKHHVARRLCDVYSDIEAIKLERLRLILAREEARRIKDQDPALFGQLQQEAQEEQERIAQEAKKRQGASEDRARKQRRREIEAKLAQEATERWRKSPAGRKQEYEELRQKHRPHAWNYEHSLWCHEILAQFCTDNDLTEEAQMHLGEAERLTDIVEELRWEKERKDEGIRFLTAVLAEENESNRVRREQEARERAKRELAKRERETMLPPVMSCGRASDPVHPSYSSLSAFDANPSQAYQQPIQNNYHSVPACAVQSWTDLQRQSSCQPAVVPSSQPSQPSRNDNSGGWAVVVRKDLPTTDNDI